MKLALIAAITLAALLNFAPRSEARNPFRFPPAQVDTETKSETPHWYPSAEWVLVFVTTITAGFICWQSWETRRAAQATRMSAEVLWASQRAQIVATAHGDAAEDLMDHEAPRIRLKVENTGTTPAFDVVYETWIEVLPRPFKDFTSDAIHHKQSEKLAVYPGSPITINVPMTGGFSEEQRYAVRKWNSHVCVRLRLEYRDARKSGRYADFGFHVLHDGLGFLSKYNDAN